MNEEVVYVIGPTDAKTVKIGRSIDTPKRIADIQRMSPLPLALLWTHPGGHELETNLHRHFSGLRTHGEWFTFQADPVQMVAWAVESEPWNLPKVSLLRPKPHKSRRRPNPYLPAESNGQSQQLVEAAIEAVLEHLSAMPDPVERYALIRDVESRLGRTFRTTTQAAVLDLRGRGLSWSEIGELLGVSLQRAHQISRGDAPKYGRQTT